MKLKHIDENSSMHPDDIYKSVRDTLAKAKASRPAAGPLDPNANYVATGDAASAEERRSRQQYHKDQDERERQRGHGRLEEEPDALSARRKDDTPPHPYRKHGTPLNKPPSDPNYPQKPFNADEWNASAQRRMKEAEELNEISNQVLTKYKTAAGADARKADKEGDTARGNKRFSGIVKATNKQFDNDRKARQPAKEGMMGGINRSAPATDVSYEKMLDDDIAPPPEVPIHYVIVDRHTKDIVGKPIRTRAGASRAVDRLDNQYGGYRYTARPVYAKDLVPKESLSLEEKLESFLSLDENKHRARTAATQAGQGNFTDILNKQHQDTTAQQPAKAVSIPFHGWEIKYKPNGKGQVDWVVIKKDKILQKGIANSDKEAVGAAEDWITQGAGEKKDMSKNATIDFNSKFVSTFAPGGETFYSTFVSNGGKPSIVISSEPHEGLQKSSIRAGSNFPCIHVTPKVARPVGLQPHGRYIIDVDNKEDLEDAGVAMYPLVFQGIIHDKTEREHMKGPGFTVAYSREADLEEQIDRWKSWAPIDPTTGQPSTKIANMQKRAPKNAKMGSPEVPFSELICDTIRKHGIRWAFQYYVIKGGVPPGQFKILAKDALENRE